MTLGRSVLSKSSSKVDWSGCTKLLLRKARLGQTAQAKAEGRPPAESDALRSNQRPNWTSHKNRQTRFLSSLSTV